MKVDVEFQNTSIPNIGILKYQAMRALNPASKFNQRCNRKVFRKYNLYVGVLVIDLNQIVNMFIAINSKEDKKIELINNSTINKRTFTIPMY